MVYYGVKAVIEKGLKTGLSNGKLPEKRPFFLKSEVLVGICFDGMFCTAPDLTDENEYNRCRESSKERGWDWIGLYRLSRDKATDCPDEERVERGEVEKLLKKQL